MGAAFCRDILGMLRGRFALAPIKKNARHAGEGVPGIHRRSWGWNQLDAPTFSDERRAMSNPLAKPSRTARKKAELKRKADRKKHERDEMAKVRKRDRVCRFPLCGCKKLGLPLEVAHLRHRGMGGNPKGDRTNTADMILLCSHRHQHGGVSLHKGTLRVVPQEGELGCDGLVAFEEFTNGAWRVIATEGYLLDDLDLRLLQLAEMED